MKAASKFMKTKLLICGGGPSALTAAIYAGRANLTPILAVGAMQGGSMVPGGQLMITTEVENYPGFPEGIAGPELMEKFSEQAARFGSKIVEEFVTFKFTPGGPHLALVGDTLVQADAVILAMGAQARWLGAPGEENFMNKGISACATCDGPLPVFRGKHIMVVGGGDSAVEEATFLTKFASKVSLIVRRDVLRASKVMQDRARANPKLEICWNKNITAYHGTGTPGSADEFISGVTVRDTITGKEERVECGGVFMAIGHIPCTSSLIGTGVALDENKYIIVKDHVETNIEGVYAAGDIHDTHFKQAITAAAFGCMAAISAERWLEAHDAVDPAAAAAALAAAAPAAAAAAAAAPAE